MIKKELNTHLITTIITKTIDLNTKIIINKSKYINDKYNIYKMCINMLIYRIFNEMII